MAGIFMSYTSSDREWAMWIATELKALGHVPFVHEWEIESGGDIYAWMEARHDAADHVLCVVSDDYLRAPYSTLERNAAAWKAATSRPGFVLMVLVKPCRLPTLSDHMRRCELFGLPEAGARQRLRDFMAERAAPTHSAFPGSVVAVSNIPIRVPEHFMGRETTLHDIERALGRFEGRVAITALHGLRGVGKTTLAAAYAERHRADYRATWWVRAQTEAGIRADLVALGARLGWLLGDELEDRALDAVVERLRHEGEGILLIYDNAIESRALNRYLPRGGSAHVLVTSNAHAWRGVAEPVEIRLWPKQIGADYLVARTGRESERADAEALTEALGGLPLAHEQAAAYCERLELPLDTYRRRFESAPVRMLDTERDAPTEFHDRLTVAKAFALAIDEAAKVHPAAAPLIVHAALLAPEPIPLSFFEEAASQLGEPLASMLAEEGLDEAIAALRAFALLDRETIVDEIDPSLFTDTIRLHRLVREVAASRSLGPARDTMRHNLTQAMATVYPATISESPASWPRARRLYAIALAQVDDIEEANSDASVRGIVPVRRMGGYNQSGESVQPQMPFQASISDLMDRLGLYCQYALTAYAHARPLFERALAIREQALGADHPSTAGSLDNLAGLLAVQGDLHEAELLLDRALAIRQRAFGGKHPEIAASLNSLGRLHRAKGKAAAALSCFERARAIQEEVLGADHYETASTLDNLARLRQVSDIHAARLLLERVLSIREQTLGPRHFQTAASLHNLARLLWALGDRSAAKPLFERALSIYEATIGPEHPSVATILNNLAHLLQAEGDLDAALPLLERAVAIREKKLGPENFQTAVSLANLAYLLQAQGNIEGARPLIERALAISQKIHLPPAESHQYRNDATMSRP
jgi:tetratricopeptide (TPR) repeat protein